MKALPFRKSIGLTLHSTFDEGRDGLNTLKAIVTIIFQAFVGYALSFAIVLLSGASKGWEAAASGIGSFVGVWAVGAVGVPLLSSEPIKTGRALALLLGTVLGSLAGTLIVVALGSAGLAFVLVFFLPLLGALAGFYGFPVLTQLFTR